MNSIVQTLTTLPLLRQGSEVEKEQLNGGENKRKEIARLSKLPNWIYQPPGCYTQTLAFATTTVAIYYYKKHILRSLNPRLLFMYWRRSVTALLVAKASAAALSKVAKPNGDCTSKGGCKIIGTTSYFWPLCLSYSTKLESESLCRLSMMTNALIRYILGLCNAKNQGATALFLKSIFSCKRMVCEFYSIDTCSYFEKYLWVQYSYPISQKFCWFSI